MNRAFIDIITLLAAHFNVMHAIGKKKQLTKSEPSIARFPELVSDDDRDASQTKNRDEDHVRKLDVALTVEGEVQPRNIRRHDENDDAAIVNPVK